MAEEATVDTLRIPGYTVGERIGAGGFGEVFRARHDVIGRDVAIKLLHARYATDPETVTRFVAEARAVGKLSHPGIVDLFDFGTLPDGRPYCVMELVRGKTLRDLLRERGRLPIAEALPILRGIAEAVDAAHAEGIAHRDLKPDNVFVVDGGVKLIDFGLAKLTREEPVTRTGAVFGTPLYMSPEQCRGGAVTIATDAYSFGVLAYHVLVGEPPFRGEALELALHHLNDEPPPPSQRLPGVGERVDRVLLALLEKAPAARPLPLRAAVESLEGERLLPARRRNRSRRRVWLAAIAAIVVCAAGAVALVVSREGSAGASTCPLAADRLAGIWDPRTRDALAARFVDDKHPDVPATWRHLAAELDAYANEWSRQWQAACASAERTTDPLLHAQRTACLDRALLQLESLTGSFMSVEVRRFALGYTTEHVAANAAPLADCTSVAVLREQRPLPPVELREEVARLERQFFATRVQHREATSMRDFDRAAKLVDEVRQIAEALEARGLPSAHVRVELMNQSTFIETRTREQAAALALETIRHAERSRDDAILAEAELQRAYQAFTQSGKIADIEDALDRAETAHVRAGHAPDTFVQARSQRAWVAIRVGRQDESLALFRSVVADRERGGKRVSRHRNFVIIALVLDGRTDDAIAEARALVERQREALGDHVLVAMATDMVSYALHASGDLDGALQKATEVLARYEQLGDVPASLVQESELWRLELALQTGRADVIAQPKRRSSDASRRLPIARRHGSTSRAARCRSSNCTAVAARRGSPITRSIALARSRRIPSCSRRSTTSRRTAHS